MFRELDRSRAEHRKAASHPTGAIGKTTGSGKVSKSDFITPLT